MTGELDLVHLLEIGWSARSEITPPVLEVSENPSNWRNVTGELDLVHFLEIGWFARSEILFHPTITEETTNVGAESSPLQWKEQTSQEHHKSWLQQKPLLPSWWVWRKNPRMEQRQRTNH